MAARAAWGPAALRFAVVVAAAAARRSLRVVVAARQVGSAPAVAPRRQATGRSSGGYLVTVLDGARRVVASLSHGKTRRARSFRRIEARRLGEEVGEVSFQRVDRVENLLQVLFSLLS
jgi:hypothetical protein